MTKSPVAKLLEMALVVAVVWGCSEALSPVRLFDGPIAKTIDARCCPNNSASGCICPPTVVGSSNGTGDTAGVAIYVEQALICPRDLARSGGPPLLGGQPWPDSALVYVAVDSGGVGNHLLNQVITLSLETIDSAGAGSDAPYGHAHVGRAGFVKPAGILTQTTVNTGDSGLVTLIYRPSKVSGPIVIRATSPGALANSVTIGVGVPLLTELSPGIHFDTIGSTTIHPRSAWVVPEVVPYLTALADSFHARFGRGLEYNDASLQLGGKFDFQRQWDYDDPTCVYTRPDGSSAVNLPGCHQTHRAGKDMDLRIKVFNGPAYVRDFTTEEKALLLNVWPLLTGYRVHQEGDHFHLYYH